MIGLSSLYPLMLTDRNVLTLATPNDAKCEYYHTHSWSITFNNPTQLGEWITTHSYSRAEGDEMAVLAYVTSVLQAMEIIKAGGARIISNHPSHRKGPEMLQEMATIGSVR